MSDIEAEVDPMSARQRHMLLLIDLPKHLIGTLAAQHIPDKGLKGTTVQGET